MTTNLDMSDPWDWDVDRVVQELCTTNRTWQPLSPAMLTISDPISLEAILREQEVNGTVILGELSMNVLRDDFGIKALGRRSFIMSAVDQFRSRSLKFQSRNMDQPPNPVASELSRSLQEAIGRFQWENVKYPPSQPLCGKELSFTRSHTVEQSPEAHAQRNQPLLASENYTSNGTTTCLIEDRPEDKLKAPLCSLSINSSIKKNSDILQNPSTLDITPDLKAPSSNVLPCVLSTNDESLESIGKKRKRIAPTLISQPIDAELATDSPALVTSLSLSLDPNNKTTGAIKTPTSNIIREPGALYIGSDGLKRVTPWLIPSSDQKELLHKNSIIAINKSLSANAPTEDIFRSKKGSKKFTCADEFMGRKKMTIDSIFYEGIPVGSEIPNTADQVEFYVGPKSLAKGRRLYVHSALKYFFRSQRQEVNNDGSFSSIVIPYSSKFVPRSQEQSFTVYQHKGHGNIVAWREAKIDVSAQTIQSIAGERSVIFNPQNRNILDFVGSTSDLDPSSLEKYQYLDGGDKILPLYGESDEENEFDEATWKEIEDELGTRSRPEQKLKKPPITEIEVIQAFNEGITDLVSKWKSKNISKREGKAWRLWTKSRYLRNKKEQIIAAERDLSHVQEFLRKMQERILSDVWTSQAQVRRQMGSIEITVFTREDLKWKISVLKQKTPPEKPQQAISSSKVKKPSSLAKVDEEGESISASEPESSSCDDMDDFIVDDNNLAPENEGLHELDLEGSEKDDITQSDSSISDEQTPLESTKARRTNRPSSNSNENPPNKSVMNMKSRSSSKSDGKAFELIDVDKSPSPVLHTNFNTPLAQSPKNSYSNSSYPSKNQFVDLTISSSEEDNTSTKTNKSPVGRTFNEQSNQKSKQIRLCTPVSNNFSPKISRTPSRVFQDGDQHKSTPIKKLYSSNDPDVIAKRSYGILRKLADRERVLIKYFNNLELNLRDRILIFFANLSEEELWSELLKFIEMMTTKSLDPSKVKNERLKQLYQILCVYEMFIDCRYYPDRPFLDESRLEKLQQYRLKHFQSFYQICYSMAQRFKENLQKSQPAEIESSQEHTLGVEIDDEDESPKPAIKRRRSNFAHNSEGETACEGETTGEQRPHGKRKKLVHENKEARDMREQNLRRLAQQDERRKKLHASLTKANDSKSIVRSQLIINDAAAEGQKLIYVNDHIAKRIKKHQVEGVRFMWNQIVTIADEKSMQGCLLAHTMGLGKTMQTITLLVAIAEAARSDDLFVSSQIPESLRVSRTLILCPPSLVNNWMDELLVWVPDDILGELRKVDSSIKSLPEKVQTIMDWREEGGVLVIGYEQFRDLINYKNKKISNSEHEKVSKDLLEGPNIIIADEAHRMKNTKAAITIAASKFRSKSRIALTGSPLANNVEEYHTMIEWVAPNYLGPIVEFRAKYVEPIQAGNYQNSTAYERRKSLKMLGVLSADLAPKVHRADMSVMKNELPPKKEFVITVPLTDIQRKAYSIFVKSMMEGNNYTTTKSGEVTSTTVWHWLAVLSLLCNHPECFRRKLLKRKEEAKHEELNSLNGTDNEDAVIDLNTPVWKVGVSQELVDAENKIFETKKSLASVQMSNKVLLLCQILDACKSVGDKALVFSQSIPTLDFLEDVFKRKNRNYARLDGSTAMSKRQGQTKDFNTGNTDVYLISTAAGGLGLNLQGANRVIIFDFKFNPIMEEQAVGRAYRIGQKKPTFIYRFIAGGTFEDSVFKTQLASKVVDKKNPIAWANKKTSEFLFEPKDVPQKDLSEFEGMDPSVLDRLLQSQKRKDQQGNPRTICSIVQTDTFAVDDDDKLTPDEEREVQSELEKTRLFRANPQAYQSHQITEQQSFRHYILNQLPVSLIETPATDHSTPSLPQNIPYPNAMPSTTNYSKDLHRPSVSSIIETPTVDRLGVTLDQPDTSLDTAKSVLHQGKGSLKVSVSSITGTSTDDQARVSVAHPPISPAVISSITNQSKDLHNKLAFSNVEIPSFHHPNPPDLGPPGSTQNDEQQRFLISPSIGNQNTEVCQIAPNIRSIKESTAPPLVSQPKIPSPRDSMATQISATKTNDLESSKSSSYMTKTPSSKPRSPVAGANTKVAKSNLGSSDSSTTPSIHLSVSNSSYKASNMDRESPSKFKYSVGVESNIIPKDSSKADSDITRQGSLTNISSIAAPTAAYKGTTSSNSSPKSHSKSGKEWDISKRYRESRASNIPDYGPLAASSTSKLRTELETPKNFLIKATAKTPRIIPFSPSQKKVGGSSNVTTSGAKDALDTARGPRTYDPSRPPFKVTTNGAQHTREAHTSLQSRISSPSSSYRRPSASLPLPPAPAYRRPPPASTPTTYRRPQPVSPPSYAPTGPRLSTTRKIPPWEESDADRAYSYRGQSYRPSQSPYHYPPSTRR